MIATLPARPVPMSDRDLCFHRTAIRLGLVAAEYKYFDTRRAVVCWNACCDAFTLETTFATDAVAIADAIEADRRIEVRPIGRKHTQRSVISQYLVVAEHGGGAAA